MIRDPDDDGEELFYEKQLQILYDSDYENRPNASGQAPADFAYDPVKQYERGNE